MTARSTIAALSVLSAALGTVHAFSVFLEPLEDATGAGRGPVSAVYATALVLITFAVLGVGSLPRWGRPRLVPAAVGIVAGAGLLLAAVANTLPVLLLGYGLLFGGANGVGYAFALESAGRAGGANGRIAGMAVVTAAYALGAAVGSLALTAIIDSHGHEAAFHALAAMLTIVGLATTLALSEPARLERLASPSGVDSSAPTIRLWAAYGTGVLAGLMSLGHAATILEERSPASTGWAVTAIALANAGGGSAVALAAGWNPFAAVRTLPLVSAVALAALALSGAAAITVGALALVGFAYGALIAVYPPLVTTLVGLRAYPRVYGRMFTAWGLAGLLGPIGAGLLFDRTGTYRLPLLLAAVVASCSAVIAATISQPKASASSPA